jgi:putative DNA primase/helicase
MTTQRSPFSTGPTPADLARIPDELKARPQWVCWRAVPCEGGRLDKIPYDPKTNPPRKASVADPASWGAFQQCVDAVPHLLERWHTAAPGTFGGGGIGFVFAPEDPYCGVDLDHCQDPATGTLEPWAEQLICRLATYAELSPSGTGVHLLAQGTLAGAGGRKRLLEIYDRGRYFTMSGQQLPDTPPTPQARQQEVDWLSLTLEVLSKALERYGERFSLLFAGRWQEARTPEGTAYASPSEADLALCSLAAQAGADAAQLEALMRLSGLYRPKWEERHGAQTYGEMTIAKVLEGGSNGTRRQAAAADAQQRRNGHAEEPLPFSDYTNAATLVRQYGEAIRYCAPWKKWLSWTGTHWQPDETGTVMQYAKATIKHLAQGAAALIARLTELSPADREKAIALAKHVKTSLSGYHLKMMVQVAQDEPGLPVLPAQLDAQPWLLNCLNGTLDLRTGELRPHRREDLLTTNPARTSVTSVRTEADLIPYAPTRIALTAAWKKAYVPDAGGSEDDRRPRTPGE